ncbi:putative membrane protein [Aliarcobacter trophiarum LMG 25534]|uniref:Membrane protein n=2 Tax=Aliarcobacter trophiarum TaxID=708186 RepID=A0AAD0VM53_9BACT|nr:putative membrane protein [Aliarcobacter trophiarum LMG 25534]
MKEGNFGTVAIDGGYLEILYNKKIIKKVKVPVPNYQAEKNRDSVVENDDGFSDKYGNEYSVYVYSSMYGIDYTIELIHSKDELKAEEFIDSIIVKFNDGEEYLNNKRNPNWNIFELILVLDFYHNNYPNIPSKNSYEIKELSSKLRKYNELIGIKITTSLRNENSVIMKLENFRALDSREEGEGLRNISNLDKKVWNEFFGNIDKLKIMAEFISKAIERKDIEILKNTNIDNVAFLEESNIHKMENLFGVSSKHTINYNNIGINNYNNIFDNHKPKLNIESITRIFANYVLNYKASHTSTIIGIFGKWGRGKTFFYNYLKYNIRQQKEDNKQIYFCKFQPWKYQEQNSAWAFLYKNILDNFLKHKKTETSKKILAWELKLKKIFNRKCWIDKFIHSIINSISLSKLWKIFLLNSKRIGVNNLYFGLISIVFIGLAVYSSLVFKIDFLVWVFGILSVPGLIFLLKSYTFFMKSKNTVRILINNYFKTKDYSDYLGFQNEIERELKFLINTYIEKDEKLILFIDDLDRCNEEMIIDIMDSLRLVLEDYEINSKITIIVAIDERILLKSIKYKYFKENNEICSKEYIEKFFLVGVKLNQLLDDDIEELVKSYSESLNIISNLNTEEENTDNGNTENGNTENGNTDNGNADNGNADNGNTDNGNTDNGNTDNGNTDNGNTDNGNTDNGNTDNGNIEILSKDEIVYINKLLIKENIDTPRKINMMIHRYLLFKSFIFSHTKLKNYNYKILIELVIYIRKEEVLNHLIQLCSVDKEKIIIKDLEDNEQEIEKDDLKKLINYAEMVSPF